MFTVGTFEDLRTDGITPVEGMSLFFYCDDADDEGNDDPLLFEGTIHYDSQLGKCYALIDKKTYHNASDELKKRCRWHNLAVPLTERAHNYITSSK